MNRDNILNYSILFVEDENEIRENYVNYLKRYFKDVFEANDGEIGLETYKEKKPDIVIIDINLPKMNGLELLEKIRENDHTTRALMLTAHSDQATLLKACELKLTRYLLKPLNRENLKSALNLAVEEIKNYKVSSNKIVQLKDGFSWNKETKELLNNNHEISVTYTERKILDLLISNLNTTFCHDDIIVYVWEDYWEDKTSALKSAIRKLRLKLPENTLINVYAEGFKIIA